LMLAVTTLPVLFDLVWGGLAHIIRIKLSLPVRRPNPQ
jgi:hypothetical protein